MIHIFILLFLSGCMWRDGHYIDDNPIEEIGEGFLKMETGIDIDFSPSSPEHSPNSRPKVFLKVKEF